MSRIIIVDENDEPISLKERNTVPTEDIYRVSALWLTNLEDHILIAQRALTKAHDPGKWGPAVAGTVEEGETYESNIKKEAMEEIGLENIMPTLGPKTRMRGEHNYFCQWYILKTDYPIERFKVQKEEIMDIRWISETDLREGCMAHPEKYLSITLECLKLFSKSKE